MKISKALWMAGAMGVPPTGRMSMLRKSLVVAVCVSFPAVALAHLCNDVFAQAKDNLAVKVDVRDGQLRIGEEASFKVYLLNTMDRTIAAIAMEVVSDKFTAEIKPARMSLKSVKEGGKKASFDVTLKRNPGVPDGKYKIELRLFDPSGKGKKAPRVFKTVNLDDAAGVIEVPKAGAVKVDGTADQAEWATSALCTGLCEYKKLKEKGGYLENVPAADEGRLRLACDKDNLYCLFQLAGAAGASAARLPATRSRAWSARWPPTSRPWSAGSPARSSASRTPRPSAPTSRARRPAPTRRRSSPIGAGTASLCRTPSPTHSSSSPSSHAGAEGSRRGRDR
jgi:hypothetical protein